MYDIIIVGAGPAGMTAAIYALRFGKKTLIIEKDTFGGQVTFSPKIENYPGYKEMSGSEFGDKLIEQVMSLGGEIEMDTVDKIEPGDKFTVSCVSGAKYTAQAVIIAVGSKHRCLGADKEEELVGNGVSYCAVCDGAFYKGRDVAVIGGGNTALQEAVMLSDICKSVTIVQNLPYLTGEKKLAEVLENKNNVNIILNAVVGALIGDGKLTAIRLSDAAGGAFEKELKVDGVFVAIGQAPENKPFENLCKLDSFGYISADETCILPTPGVFAAGDCRSKSVRQIATAIADGASAAVAACKYIDSK